MPTSKVQLLIEIDPHQKLSWQEYAACKGMEDLFSYNSLNAARATIPKAMQICETCPVLQQCKDWSVSLESWSGVVIGGAYYGITGKRYEK